MKKNKTRSWIYIPLMFILILIGGACNGKPDASSNKSLSGELQTVDKSTPIPEDKNEVKSDSNPVKTPATHSSIDTQKQIQKKKMTASKKTVTKKKTPQKKRTTGRKQKSKEKARPILHMEEKVFHFDTITEGDVVQHRFFFSNFGQAPLIFKGGHATCGCTTPVFPREPVKPGQASYIYVSFNSKEKPGEQNAKVFFKTNASDKELVLQLKGFVKEKK